MKFYLNDKAVGRRERNLKAHSLTLERCTDIIVNHLSKLTKIIVEKDEKWTIVEFSKDQLERSRREDGHKKRTIMKNPITFTHFIDKWNRFSILCVSKRRKTIQLINKLIIFMNVKKECDWRGPISKTDSLQENLKIFSEKIIYSRW